MLSLSIPMPLTDNLDNNVIRYLAADLAHRAADQGADLDLTRELTAWEAAIAQVVYVFRNFALPGFDDLLAPEDEYDLEGPYTGALLTLALAGESDLSDWLYTHTLRREALGRPIPATP